LSFSQPVFEKFFRSQAPFEIVANFAAHKHVRSEKDLISIEAMLENNVLSAKHLLDLLLEHPPEHFFAVSTDKAANPVNVMGASKKMMEDVILAYSAYFPCTTARFANVAFSNGSLLFGFLERLMKRQPLSVPSDIRRFFVSPTESGQLCLLACALGRSGEVFFPKLDPEKDLISFRDITLQFLAAMGYEADECSTEEEARQKSLSLQADSRSYPVYFFESDTSGEKPFEEFFTEREKLDLTRFLALGVIEDLPKKSLQEIEAMVQSLRAFFAETDADKQGLVERISQYVADFEHIERGKNLDQKM
jgi:FlaA1/EpsC-like NDP-sugar epimerase